MLYYTSTDDAECFGRQKVAVVPENKNFTENILKCHKIKLVYTLKATKGMWQFRLAQLNLETGTILANTGPETTTLRLFRVQSRAAQAK